MRVFSLASSAFLFFERVVRELVRLVLQIVAGLIALIFLAVLAGLFLAVPAGLVYAIYKAFPPDPIEAKANASWLDLIFSNQYVIFAARIVLISLALVLLFAGIYIAVSIFVRMYKREWLKRAGGLEADVIGRAVEEIEAVKKEQGALIEQLIAEKEDLADRLEATTAELESLRGVSGTVTTETQEGH